MSALVRWHYGARLSTPVTGLRRIVLIVCLLHVLFVVTWAMVGSSLDDPSEFTARLDSKLLTIEVLGIIAAIGSLAALLYAWRTLKSSETWWFTKVAAIAIALACCGSVWFGLQWHLTNLNLHY